GAAATALLDHHRGGGRGGHVEGLLELLHELGELDQRHLLERVEKLCTAQLCHVGSAPSYYSLSEAALSAAPPSVDPRFSCRAATVRAALDSGAWNTAAALLRFAFIAPASFASSTSRDSRSASLVTSAAEIVRPSKTPPLITSSGLVRAKSRRLLAASTGSPETKASAVGPVNRASRPSMPASAAARLAKVFLVTAYVVVLPSARRRVVICATVSPRYSVSTVAGELRKWSVSSATAAPLSSRILSAMSLPSLLRGRSRSNPTARVER